MFCTRGDTACAGLIALLVPALTSPGSAADPVRMDVLVPITGFLALEGTAQRNGAVLALDTPPDGITVT